MATKKTTTGLCAMAILQTLGVHNARWTYNKGRNIYRNTLRRNGWGVRSRDTALGVSRKSGISVTDLKKRIGSYADHERYAVAYLVRVEAHVLLIDKFGEVVVDTDPQASDRRQVLHVDAIVWTRNAPFHLISCIF